jgi:indolepyruvate ferredoxin oxidoreductase beta subunit
MDSERKRITIAILALGGQGGGVLADWIVELAGHNAYLGQATSIAGVAQRTGATVYYLELFPDTDTQPVLALMPVPGDVDVVIASELVEAGRAILRGLVTANTTLIASTHRVYSIAEKSAMGDGIQKDERIVAAALKHAGRFIAFNMDAECERTKSMISAVMFGALAGSGVLPFPRAAFEETIRATGMAVKANLSGFEAGYAATERPKAQTERDKRERPQPTTSAGRALAARIAAELPRPAYDLATEGVRRLMDYQDDRYAHLYLDRLKTIRDVDSGYGDHALTSEAARYLALWMSYEDAIRVADLKTRTSRFARVRDEVQLSSSQLLGVTEYMHPRIEEICDTLPRALGAAVSSSKATRRLLGGFFSRGRYVKTTSIGWFLVLHALASLRRWRRGTLRYHKEQARIEKWIELVVRTASIDPPAALEIVECQRLIKGYGATFEHGLRNYEAVIGLAQKFRARPDCAAIIRTAREAALDDENGEALSAMTAGIAGAM